MQTKVIEVVIPPFPQCTSFHHLPLIFQTPLPHHPPPRGLAQAGPSLGHVYSILLFLRPLISTVMGTKGGTKRIAALGPRTRPRSLITVVIETRLPLSPPVDPSHGAKMNGIFDSLQARGVIGLYVCLCVEGGLNYCVT